jgi:ribonucleoside-diphosphate reductase beta chain
MFYLIYTEFLMTAAIFNSAKTIEEYKNTPIFMGPEPGFMDTIYKNHPKLWNLYKELKALDWSEDEFDFTRCLLDFKNCHQDTSDMMIETIGWQWEADSVAGRSVVSLLDWSGRAGYIQRILNLKSKM